MNNSIFLISNKARPVMYQLHNSLVFDPPSPLPHFILHWTYLVFPLFRCFPMIKIRKSYFTLSWIDILISFYAIKVIYLK